MPVSFLPLLIPVSILIGLFVAFHKGKRAFKLALAASLLLIALAVLPFYLYGWFLMVSAHRGDARAQYKLAKWHENHCGDINAIILWPCDPDVESGYEWVERASRQDYPPALYTLGVRLKYGMFVPHPGVSIHEWVPQPEKGQPYIDRALGLGYKPLVDEQSHYWQVFRETHFKERI